MEHRGIVLGLYASDPGFDYAVSLDEIRAMHASTVLLLVTIDQATIETPRPGPFSAAGERVLRRVLRQARERELRVAVLPIVAVKELAVGKWRGTISPPDWHAWFDAYRTELTRIARIADEGRADLLAVGSELCSSEEHEDEWLQTISAVRKSFSGKLTYSSNWDHLPLEPWVETLDFLGLNAYFELVCEDQATSLPGIVQAWRQVQTYEVEPWQRRFGKPIVFLEVGYPSTTGADRYPWDYEKKPAIDEGIQQDLYAAFLRSWEDRTYVDGVFFYVWWEGADRDPWGYTPRGKPAGELLRAWFQHLGEAR
ncbi:MAG: hypothetical protein U0166_27680 [Acidobacteriota bacterium]